MASEIVFAIPGDIDTPTGGYAYDRRLLGLLPDQGVRVRHLALPGSFPWASVGDLAETQALLQATPEEATLLIDGLALGAMTDLVLRSVFRPIVALVHHPLALETGLPDRRRRALAASETAALARARHVIATSRETARLLAADYAVPPGRLTVAEPGCDPAPRAAGSGEPAPVLLAVGAVSPRKGYDVLIEALATLRDRPWRLRIAGATDRAPEETDRLRALVAAHGLGDRVAFEGSLAGDALENAYARADLFVHAAHYEGYGMVLAEAMARGLPMVATTGGAAAETVPDGAGLKVPPGDPAALAQAIAALLDDPARRSALADASWAAGQRLPRWELTAATVAAVLKGVTP
ncbi:glycosyl transferase family 1 [Alsobacter soli]|uniref:Glycosyl transferase family 1 n=1 Tax=Alsobacter soli TaxID=2109933 RepID=A0A2T1HLY4_9HYPH|nr:glycosyltransferase family 4 protein [Alsobacter soli]PSC02663.1 glycosyl transferase family 1 [Alsobacter soli]